MPVATIPASRWNRVEAIVKRANEPERLVASQRLHSVFALLVVVEDTVDSMVCRFEDSDDSVEIEVSKPAAMNGVVYPADTRVLAVYGVLGGTALADVNWLVISQPEPAQVVEPL